VIICIGTMQEPTLQMPSRNTASSLSGSESDYQHTRELIETWILLELCTEGSLQVCCTLSLWKMSEPPLHFWPRQIPPSPRLPSPSQVNFSFSLVTHPCSC